MTARFIPRAPGFWVGWRVLCRHTWRGKLCMASDLTQLRERAL
ncbi:MAG TPA: hypothetical protein VLK85_04450 [Ramlibacter sp.]|nr:hypothetical protein [Ramlibacter sp.]